MVAVRKKVRIVSQMIGDPSPGPIETVVNRGEVLVPYEIVHYSYGGDSQEDWFEWRIPDGLVSEFGFTSEGEAIANVHEKFFA